MRGHETINLPGQRRCSSPDAVEWWRGHAALPKAHPGRTSARGEPDYRNAVKEAISAVEGAAKLIKGADGGGLKGALDALGQKFEIHPALRDALLKLYGYTSDAEGIRHPLRKTSTLGDEDARLMIVACSAVVNWIIAKAEKVDLLKKT